MVALQLWQCKIQYEVREKLEKELLQTIAVSSEELIWNNKKEVSINGRLFDVQFCKAQDGKYILTGLFDDKETEIKNLLKKQVSQFYSPFMQLLILGQCFAAIICFIDFFFLPAFTKRLWIFTCHYSFYFYRLTTPPPKPLFVFS